MFALAVRHMVQGHFHILAICVVFTLQLFAALPIQKNELILSLYLQDEIDRSGKVFFRRMDTPLGPENVDVTDVAKNPDGCTKLSLHGPGFNLVPVKRMLQHCMHPRTGVSGMVSLSIPENQDFVVMQHQSRHEIFPVSKLVATIGEEHANFVDIRWVSAKFFNKICLTKEI